MRSVLVQQKQAHKSTSDLHFDKSFDDPLWLDIKEGLDAAVQGKMKRWKPRVLKSK